MSEEYNVIKFIKEEEMGCVKGMEGVFECLEKDIHSKNDETPHIVFTCGTLAFDLLLFYATDRRYLLISEEEDNMLLDVGFAKITIYRMPCLFDKTSIDILKYKGYSLSSFDIIAVTRNKFYIFKK